MKTMTCNQLAGACDKKFTAETFEEISEMSKAHGMEMFETLDKDHLEAMEKMKEIGPEGYGAFFEEKRKEFDALPEDK